MHDRRPRHRERPIREANLRRKRRRAPHRTEPELPLFGPEDLYGADEDLWGVADSGWCSTRNGFDDPDGDGASFVVRPLS